MSISKRHHYIPQFLIKGFVSDDKKLSVFDRKENVFLASRKSPKQVFYEWNRNLFEKDGEKTDFVEKLFSNTENKFAPAYTRIINKIGKGTNKYVDLFHMIHYLGTLYNSLPQNDIKISKYVQNSNFKDLGFSIKSKNTNKGVSQEEIEKLQIRFKSDLAFEQLIKLWKGITDYLEVDIIEFYKTCKLYHAETDVRLHILGDRPFLLILNQQRKLDVLRCKKKFCHNNKNLNFQKNRSRLTNRILSKKTHIV